MVCYLGKNIGNRVVVMKDGSVERIANVEVAAPPPQRAGSLPQAS